MTQLDEYRASIDNIDTALISLLAERFRITKKVGLFKAENLLPEQDSTREAEQMEKVERLSRAAGLEPEIGKRVLRVIIDQVVAEHKEVRKGFFTST